MKHQVISVITLKSSLKNYITSAHHQWVFFLWREEVGNLIPWLHYHIFVSAVSRPPGLYRVTSLPLQLFRSEQTHDPGGPGHGLGDH